MGGSVRVAVRYEDGTTQARVRWTNSLPYFVRSQGNIESPAELWRSYMAEKSEYDFEGSNLIAPYSYGLVVFDIKTRTIAHSNGYSSFTVQYPSMDNMDEDDLTNLRYFISTDKVRLETTWSTQVAGKREKQPTESTKVDLATLEQTVRADSRKMYDGSVPRRSVHHNLVFDLAPWKLVRFDESLAGGLQLRDWLLANGFAFSDAEKAEWLAWEADRQEAIEEAKKGGCDG